MEGSPWWPARLEWHHEQSVQESMSFESWKIQSPCRARNEFGDI
jgi:hypothetical protein